VASPLKRWFRVADSILRDELTRDQRSTFLGLLAWFNQRRARDGVKGQAACRALIPHGDLLTITLAEDLEEARQLLEEIRERFKLRISARGKFTEVRWPKVAEFQQWDTPDSGQSPGKARAKLGQARPGRDPALAPSESDPNPNRSDSESEEERPASAARPRRIKFAKTHAPDSLNSDEYESLRAWCAEKHAALLPRLPALVEACLDHHRAKGNTHADWVATCRTWVRNESSGVFGRASPRSSEAKAEQAAATTAAAVDLIENMRRSREQRDRPDGRAVPADVRQLRPVADT
jgi:hypothetical protein